MFLILSPNYKDWFMWKKNQWPLCYDFLLLGKLWLVKKYFNCVIINYKLEYGSILSEAKDNCKWK